MRIVLSRRSSSSKIVATIVGTVVLASSGFALYLGGTGVASASSATSWTVYHGDAAGLGVSTALKAVTTSKRSWTSPALSGQLYGEPLVFSSDVYVATENDTVYALSAANGRVIWARHVGPAVPSSALPCGDITPSVGITGTPVIDPSRDELFVVADELVGGKPEHYLVGLSTTSGAIELRVHVDPPGAVPSALLQRTGLNLDAGRVVFAFGGNYGDCASYRGRVESVKETGSAPAIFSVDATAGDSQGSIWMGGAAPVVDAKGNIWVSVGNGSVHSTGQAYDDSDSVLELSASMHLEQYFAPSDWPENNASDADMSMAPALLADGQVVLAGKSRIVYLLSGAHLGGIGNGEASIPAACSNDIDGGPATVGNTVYLPCLGGTVAVRASAAPASVKVLWQSSVGGGPAIYAAGKVWTVGQSGVLYGLNPSTGAVRQQAPIGSLTNHFTTPSVGDALMVVATSKDVVAFHAVVN
ncbi:MAG TPA: PQQ-binding-like beta-propeller repeat protein [Acidimicrobiales bacterium]